MSDETTKLYLAALPGRPNPLLEGVTAARTEPVDITVTELRDLPWPSEYVDPAQVSHTEWWTIDNTVRAGYAVTALHAYASKHADPDSEQADDLLRLLLANFMHLADTLGLDFYQEVEQARATYYAPEVHGEP